MIQHARSRLRTAWPFLIITTLTACGSESMSHHGSGGADTTGLRDLPVPAELAHGAELYHANCASCHGDTALGSESGPPLVHRVYAPNHHADGAFLLAVRRGVRAHHWHFGDMPPQPQVSADEVEEIVRYVRWLQREAGIQ